MPRALEVVEVAPKGALKEELEVRGRVEQQVVTERPDERWTEITKDLIVREAIERLGYEFEETRKFYYIFSFLQPVSVCLSLGVSQRQECLLRLCDLGRH